MYSAPVCHTNVQFQKISGHNHGAEQLTVAQKTTTAMADMRPWYRARVRMKLHVVPQFPKPSKP